MDDLKIDKPNVVSVSFIDELDYVDADIKEQFQNKVYNMTIPTNIQLAREIKELNTTVKHLSALVERYMKGP